MYIYRTVPMLLSFALLGCGGSQVQPEASLQGTWYFQTTDNPAMLVGRHIITQRDDDILITYCDRLTYALLIQNEVLIDPRGLPYYLQPSGSDSLVGRGDTGNRVQAVKVSGQVTFDSGSLSVLAAGMDELVTSQDVCAQEGAGRFVAFDGTEIAPRVVTITAPYKNDFIRIRAAFHSLSPGTYSVVEINSFIHKPEESVYLDIESPVYGDTFAEGGGVSIASGTVSIKNSELGNFQLEGLLSTTVGKAISFSSTVVLGK